MMMMMMIIIIIIIIPGKHSIDSLQKTAILGTSHMILKILQCETSSLSGGDHRWFQRSTRKKRPVTRDDDNDDDDDDDNNNNVNCFDLFFRSGLTRRLPPNN
jgi:hypothetical protein